MFDRIGYSTTIMRSAPRLPLAVCCLLAVAWFGDALLPGRTLIPAGHLYQVEPWKSERAGVSDPVQQHDMVFQFYPWARFFRDSVQRGSFPLWNPYNYLGTPFFANPQTALLFPLTWLHLIVPLTISFTLVLMLKLFLAASGMWFWLRSRRLRPEAATLGAAAFALSMHTVAGLPFPYASVTVLFPWLLLALHRAVGMASAGAAVALALMTALVVLAGQPQSALVAVTAAVLYLLVDLRCSLRTVVWFRMGIPMLAGGLLAAVQWLPAWTYTAESMVPEGPRLIHSGYPYAPASFLTLLIPDFFGSLLDGTFWGFPGYHDLTLYSSVLVLLLLPAAITRSQGSPALWQSPFVIAAGAVLVLSGVPPFEWLLDLPGFDLIRRNKLVFLVIFGLCELAAVGLQRRLGDSRDYADDPDHADHSDRPDFADHGDCADGAEAPGSAAPSWRRLGIAAGVMAAAGITGLLWFSDFLGRLDPTGRVLWMAGRSALFLGAGLALLRWCPPRWTGWALVAVVLADLAPLSWPLNPRGSADSLYPPPAVREHLTGNPPRIYGLDNVFFPNSASVFGLQDVRGYDVMTPRRLFRLMQRVDPALGDAWSWLMRFDPREITPETRMRRIIGAWAERDPALKAYLQSESYWSVGVGRIRRPDLFERLEIEYLLTAGSPVPPGYQPAGHRGPIGVWRRPDARPFRLYAGWVRVTEQDAVDCLGALPEGQVAVEANLPPPPPPAVPGARVERLEWSPERQRFLVDSAMPVVLVVFERWSEGWEAVLEDGSRLEMFPCNAVFRGVYLPPGRQQVEMRYRPRSLQWGLGLTGAGTALVAVWTLSGVWRRRKG
jgi:hypothetical protein